MASRSTWYGEQVVNTRQTLSELTILPPADAPPVEWRVSDTAVGYADALAAMDGKFWAYYRIARAVKLPPDGSLTFVSGLLSQKAAPGAALVSAVNRMGLLAAGVAGKAA